MVNLKGAVMDQKMNTFVDGYTEHDKPHLSFSANIIADSVNIQGNRVTSFMLTYPRFIHSEIMTHRVFSRNCASSRAIPINKVIEQVNNNPAGPIRWGKNGKGMQDHGSFEQSDGIKCQEAWAKAAKSAVESALMLDSLGLHKQIVNRVLEPFVWMTTLVTSTEWQNFFSLRLHKDAQPEFQKIAHMMLLEYIKSVPDPKKWGEWHIPFGDRMPEGLDDRDKLKIATARAARTSYMTMDGQINVEKDIFLHNNLANNGHWSPFEHSCQASLKVEKGNFVGWKQYRHTFEEENRRCNLESLLEDYESSI